MPQVFRVIGIIGFSLLTDNNEAAVRTLQTLRAFVLRVQRGDRMVATSRDETTCVMWRTWVLRQAGRCRGPA